MAPRGMRVQLDGRPVHSSVFDVVDHALGHSRRSHRRLDHLIVRWLLAFCALGAAGTSAVLLAGRAARSTSVAQAQTAAAEARAAVDEVAALRRELAGLRAQLAL
jgi:hypothetical protein